MKDGYVMVPREDALVIEDIHKVFKRRRRKTPDVRIKEEKDGKLTVYEVNMERVR